MTLIAPPVYLICSKYSEICDVLSFYTPVKLNIKPKGTFGETGHILFSLAMQLTRINSTVLFLIGVMAVTAGCSTVQTTQNTPSGALAPQSREDSSSEYVNSVTDTPGGYYEGTSWRSAAAISSRHLMLTLRD